MASKRDYYEVLGFQTGLLLGREIALSIHLPQGVAHGCLGRIERALSARALLRLAGRCGAMERQGRLGECARQHVGRSVDNMKAQVVLPRLERLRRDQCRQTLECARLPGYERLLPGQACRGEEGGPVHARRPAREVGTGPQAVGVVVVGRRFARGLSLRHGGFQSHDRSGPLVRTVESGQCHEAADVLLVSGSERLHLRLGTDIVLAVGQAEPALQQEGDVGFLPMDAGLHGQTQQMGRSVAPPVERVDIGAEPAAQEPGERRLVPDVIDAVQ